MKIVIAGNGPAAISAIEAIRASDRASEIIVLSKEKEQAYSPCFLYHYVSGEITKEKLYIKEEDFYEKNNVHLLAGIYLEKVNPHDKRLLLSDGKKISYDKLLIATGAEPIIPSIDGIEGEGVLPFKTLQDTERILAKIECRGGEGTVRKAVVIGGGFTGLEIAEALKKRGLYVTVIEKEDRVLPRMFDREMAEIIKDHLTNNHIDILTGTKVLKIEREKGNIKAIRTDRGTIDTEIIIISAGIRPNIGPVSNTDIKTERGIIINERCETNIKDIYAAGDVAELEIKGIKKINPIWSNATIQGTVAGSNMVGVEKRIPEHLPDMNLINLFGLYIFSAGMPEGPKAIKREDLSGIKKFILDEEERIKGIQIIGKASLKGGLYLTLLSHKIHPLIT
jgi:nitrite reductase (NADH) large subunit